MNRVVLIIDESGSMESVQKETQDAINEQIRTLKDQKRTTVSLYKFSTNVKNVFMNLRSQDLKEIDSYNPVGLTALYDAIGEAIEDMDAAPHDKVLFVIFTDGMNNNSKKFNQSSIAELIKSKKNWTFTFMGTTEDQMLEAQKLNIPVGNSFKYDPTDIGIRNASGQLRCATINYLSSQDGVSENFFSGSECKETSS